MELISVYDFEVSYINGKENSVADALSQKKHITSMVSINTNFRAHILQKLNEDEFYLHVREAL